MILFVDDEKRIMDSYVEELRRSHYEYEVEFKSNVDDALDFFEKNSQKISLLILDIMMPPGSKFEEAKNEAGLRTGIHFYNRVRRISPNLQVIIFTNVSDERVMEKFTREKNCLFLRKEEFLPYQFANEVKKIVG